MMLRLVLIAFIGWLIWRLLAPAKAPGVKKKPETEAPGVENMLACAHCGVYVPEGEMLADADGRRYCCAEHRKLGARA
ncbi:MAG: hypothetical protein LBQ81_08305 [Zoogloeaceae bacterium]|jgi:uncharacterized protein|nr:hypothetical protein [Zoogloeaceae bacterium]